MQGKLLLQSTERTHLQEIAKPGTVPKPLLSNAIQLQLVLAATKALGGAGAHGCALANAVVVLWVEGGSFEVISALGSVAASLQCLELLATCCTRVRAQAGAKAGSVWCRPEAQFETLVI